VPCTPETGASEPTSDSDALHDWGLGLPWVVERPHSPDLPGLRTFGVDCAPMGVRSVWLVTGLQDSSGVAVVVPEAVGADLDLLRLAEPVAPMSDEHVFVSVCTGLDAREIERVLLEAYTSTFA
jgi:hypothetical protein